MKNVKKEYQKMQLFEKVCIIYSKDLQRFIYTLTRKDPFAMEEIYQNTMLGALKGLNFLRDSSKMKAWIFAIAKAESKRYYAANKPENNYGISIVTEESAGLEYLFDFTKSVEDRESVKALINSLSDEEQQLYILHYYYDLPFKEISEILNVNYNTIRSMHMRGMAKMRKQLTEGESAAPLP
ncbi:MAG TPA: sigma-70 family RNA polymerase sigma factor [Anaerovoracaceae bacterium]|nr:sigma-70 family RNA polymerase sigma factor [Anaerovoracaceae bacterium]